jgi:hypothetical protein
MEYFFAQPKLIREYLYTQLCSTLVCDTTHLTGKILSVQAHCNSVFASRTLLLTVLSHPMISNAVLTEVTVHLSILRWSFGQVQIIKQEDLFLSRIFK